MKSLPLAIFILMGSATCLLADSAPPAELPSTRPAATTRSIDADKKLDELLGSRPGTVRPIQPIPGQNSAVENPLVQVAPEVPLIPLKREGSMITARIGRLERSEQPNTWEFYFESDGKALVDPPMILLPNLKLAAMQDNVKSSGRDLRFKVTGTITEYRGRNYLLVEKAEVVTD